MTEKTGGVDFIDPPGDEGEDEHAHTPAKRGRPRKKPVHATEEPAAPPPVAEEAPPEPKVTPRWRVELRCPTPLAHRSAEVEAENEDGAKKAFCDLNNISDSVHEWDIRRL